MSRHHELCMENRKRKLQGYAFSKFNFWQILSNVTLADLGSLFIHFHDVFRKNFQTIDCHRPLIWKMLKNRIFNRAYTKSATLAMQDFVGKNKINSAKKVITRAD